MSKRFDYLLLWLQHSGRIREDPRYLEVAGRLIKQEAALLAIEALDDNQGSLMKFTATRAMQEPMP